MSENARDTKFAGFASRLIEEIVGSNSPYVITPREFFEQWQLTIARRAYDLVSHTLAEQIAVGNIEQGSLEMVMECVPDMTTWPEEVKP